MNTRLRRRGSDSGRQSVGYILCILSGGLENVRTLLVCVHSQLNRIMKYNGNDVFAPFNAGLYGVDEDSDRALQYDESKEIKW